MLSWFQAQLGSFCKESWKGALCSQAMSFTEPISHVLLGYKTLMPAARMQMGAQLAYGVVRAQLWGTHR